MNTLINTPKTNTKKSARFLTSCRFLYIYSKGAFSVNKYIVPYTNLYKNDYKMALLMHSMSWSIMLLIPAMFLLNVNGYALLGIFVVNTFIHYHIDNLKANKKQINLMFDQTIHIMQIIATWIMVQQWIC